MSLAPYLHLDELLEDRRAGEVVAVPAATLHHLTRVLRVRPGDAVVVADGRGGQAAGTWTGDAVSLTQAPEHLPPPRPTLGIAQALAKGRKVDEVVRQATELGVDRITGLATARCVVRLDADKARRAQQRWTEVARAAAEQSRRATRPEVGAVTDLPGLLAGAATGEVVLLAHPRAASLVAVLGATPDARHITIAIGPEGGFSDDEVAVATDAGAHAVGLGSSVLRTEHAAPAAVAAIAALTGRWG
ncbi:MAG: 16S rRNA (uracil(1498)-N(3))-methyltransferase [Nitriliruptoraceae bacterium]|nr:16S rRNA (uracil(1498)-N(3))-methyltransferase [Nitriliruptoraceae bacterium]